MLDTADLYGPMHNERLVGKAIAGKRDRFAIATRFGVELDDDGNWIMGITYSLRSVFSLCISLVPLSHETSP